jgi:hypothetical protein
MRRTWNKGLVATAIVVLIWTIASGHFLTMGWIVLIILGFAVKTSKKSHT